MVAGVVVKLGLVLERHGVADDIEVQVEVDPNDRVATARRFEASRGVDLVAVQRPVRVRVAAQHPPLAGHRDPQLVAIEDLDRP